MRLTRAKHDFDASVPKISPFRFSTKLILVEYLITVEIHRPGHDPLNYRDTTVDIRYKPEKSFQTYVNHTIKVQFTKSVEFFGNFLKMKMANKGVSRVPLFCRKFREKILKCSAYFTRKQSKSDKNLAR